MATTNPESRLTAKLLDVLRTVPHSHFVKLHVDPYNSAGEPDIFGCVEGEMVCIEVKTPANARRTTALQRVALTAWAAAGAHVAVIASVDELVAWLYAERLVAGPEWAGGEDAAALGARRRMVVAVRDRL